MATCHPSRERFSKEGVCHPCYLAAGGAPVRMATCHPQRKHQGKGLCRSCYMIRWLKGSNYAPWSVRNPVKYRASVRRSGLKKLGLTPPEYEAMWNAQAGKCANPGCPKTAPMVLSDHRNGLVVDHNHTTGAVRGLLCRGCNTALGHTFEDPKRLAGLIEYLTESLN